MKPLGLRYLAQAVTGDKYNIQRLLKAIIPPPSVPEPPSPRCSAQTFWRHLQLLPSSGSVHSIHQQIHPTSGRHWWPGPRFHLSLDDCPISTHALLQSSTNSQDGSHDGPNGQSTSLICPKPFNSCPARPRSILQGLLESSDSPTFVLLSFSQAILASLVLPKHT